jgi:hypothetical protein
VVEGSCHCQYKRMDNTMKTDSGRGYFTSLSSSIRELGQRSMTFVTIEDSIPSKQPPWFEPALMAIRSRANNDHSQKDLQSGSII